MPFTVMNENNNNVKIKQSSIVGAGNGLFANKKFKKGDYICAYSGVLVDNEVVNRGDYISQYIYQHYNGNYAIDADDELSCYGRYINDSLSKRKTNCEFNQHKDSDYAYVRAVKNIKKGDEIFVKYGPEYWTGDNRNGLPNADILFIRYEYNDEYEDADDDEDEYDEEEEDDDDEYIPTVKHRNNRQVKQTIPNIIDLTDDDDNVIPVKKKRYRAGIIPTKR